MDRLALDHYEVLEVSRNADSAAIKQAYFRLIRQYTPESDPERFRLVTEAYRVLSHRERRKEYDSEERVPPAVMARVQRAVAEHDPEEGADELRAICDEYSSFRGLRFVLGVQYDRLDRQQEAAAVFESLFDEEPENAVYATWLGDALLKSGRTTRGVKTLKQAIVLDAHHTDAYLCLARHHASEDRPDEALRILERGIHADGKIDVEDLPLLTHTILLQAGQGKWDQLRKSASRITTLVPADDEMARGYVASQLHPLLQVFHANERPDLLHYVMEIITELTPDDEAARQAAAELQPAAALWHERTRLLDDPGAPQWLKAMVVALTFDEGFDKERVLTNLALQVGSDSAASSTWNRMRREYPTLLAELQPAWQGIRELGAQARRRSSPADGCLVLLVMLAGLGWGIGALL